MGKEPKIEIKSLKTMQGREGVAYTCTLHVDGKKAAFVRDEGNGGCLWIDWTPTRKAGGSIFDSPVKDRLEAHCAEKAPLETEFGPLSWNLDLLIGEAVEDEIERRALKRWCRTKVVFRLEGDARGEYRTIKMKFAGNEDRVRAMLAQDFGDRVAEIVNERFAA